MFLQKSTIIGGGAILCFVLFSVMGIHLWWLNASPKNDGGSGIIPEGSGFHTYGDLGIWSFPLDSVMIDLMTGDDFATVNTRAGGFLSGGSSVGLSSSTVSLITNGPIYDTGPSLLGLVVQDGRMAHRLNRDEGQGNFFLQPNGVLYRTVAGEWGMLPRDTFAFFYPTIRDIAFAIQAGPMMIISDRINSHFNPGSTNSLIRNAVCMDKQGFIHHVFAYKPITLYAMSSQMKEHLGCVDALYLDGVISGYRDSAGRSGGVGPYHTFLLWR